jgi:hypothetical protein
MKRKIIVLALILIINGINIIYAQNFQIPQYKKSPVQNYSRKDTSHSSQLSDKSQNKKSNNINQDSTKITQKKGGKYDFRDNLFSIYDHSKKLEKDSYNTDSVRKKIDSTLNKIRLINTMDGFLTTQKPPDVRRQTNVDFWL